MVIEADDHLGLGDSTAGAEYSVESLTQHGWTKTTTSGAHRIRSGT
ncbi:hypothetical protein [Streptomyces sp. NPDC006463]